MSKIFEIIFGSGIKHRAEYFGSFRQPQPPLGFVKRSDPNFYFLSRKY